MGSTFMPEFGIDFVINTDLGEDIPKYYVGNIRRDNADYYIDCPVCEGHFKMNVSVNKNCCHCVKCDSKFSMVSLHRYLYEFEDNKQAYKDLKAKWEGILPAEKITLKYRAMENKDMQIKPAPIMVRDKFYRAFLHNLTLEQQHRNDLLKRGLSNYEIDSYYFKSVPQMNLQQATNTALLQSKLKEWFIKHDDVGIPGFYDLMTRSPEMVKRSKGYFVPVITFNGLISGLQIRYDPLPEDAPEWRKKSYHKYAWFSSSEKGTGCSISGCENLHHSGNWYQNFKDINITEGILKGTVASALSGKNAPFLCVAGVNSTNQLKEELVYLKNFGCERVNIFWDMDYHSNENVEKSLEKLKSIALEAGLSVRVMEWNTNYKGIDDYLLARRHLQEIREDES